MHKFFIYEKFKTSCVHNLSQHHFAGGLDSLFVWIIKTQGKKVKGKLGNKKMRNGNLN